ncbi:hypothetical protein A2473_01780 [candidate division WWE3 bacterium RIFOXYC2_FULL_42_13]|uniref:Uncharacterized protein n=2 Tax=Katanobacteria TaxID=422282 RepID=A0A0G1HKN3_UNCKA|nr:MAG: hypothetical protein UV89_C0014G0013 [candidate division WWE3 bacterium GW2011_GWB2_43_22]OGC59160.1 MAG: hypothetical protein A2245_03810 [candidate division WWE3 bacterium RIFOXYA2_FULL_43_12]OGC66848.1 MAG: hypothetical protein A2274_03135 [candidate division WWE3 bacterium RIFOXYA12_FULL_43_11]OGC72425.1 MAG: hypothetical protein A2337_02715 [candidate division WWE3 bacterium RIFOXYB2_FULL_43_9]OGC73728.1 MAG: hypothetical protein A2473_01780 [candidate division WWE3 bacterium RIFOX
MDEQINTPTEQQPQAEPMPDWNTPKPVEDELNKYSTGKGLKIFLIIGFLVILAAIGLFVYQTMVKGKTPTEQLQREPVTVEVKEEQPVVEKEKTSEEQIDEIDNVNIEEMDQLIIETDLDDLNL